MAPVVTAKADPVEQPGVIEKPAPTPPSQGPGTDGGAGSGQGTGNGEGSGSGIGDGAGGGTGGGPYRPGSGIEAPRLLREVKAEYTDEARRRGITGDVVLEIVVRRDGSVGDVTVLQGLGSASISARSRRSGNGASLPRAARRASGRHRRSRGRIHAAVTVRNMDAVLDRALHGAFSVAAAAAFGIVAWRSRVDETAPLGGARGGALAAIDAI